MDNLRDVLVFENDCFSDLRGDLWTNYNSNNFPLDLFFNHDKVAVSNKNVLRGLHGDSKSHKYISCVHGLIKFAVVDFRKDSDQYLKWQIFTLDSSSPIKQSLIVPPNFLTGHLVLSESAVFYYKWSYEGSYPDVDQQFSVNWKDPTINIDWGIDDPILSERDINSQFLR